MNYAANAYARTSRSALTPREAESAVLLKATAMDGKLSKRDTP